MYKPPVPPGCKKSQVTAGAEGKEMKIRRGAEGSKRGAEGSKRRASPLQAPSGEGLPQGRGSTCPVPGPSLKDMLTCTTWEGPV